MTQRTFEVGLGSIITAWIVAIVTTAICHQIYQSPNPESNLPEKEIKLPDRLTVVSQELEINDGGGHYNFYVVKDSQTNQEFVVSPRCDILTPIPKN